MYFVYALYSPKFDKIYVGYSENAKKRLKSHNDERNNGWTGKFQPWEIVYTEICETKTEALKREKQLKSAAGRRFVRGIIKNN
ncbi:MAG: GIY-YIG nuclease family protein [Bacteroidota bacterium]